MPSPSLIVKALNYGLPPGGISFTISDEVTSKDVFRGNTITFAGGEGIATELNDDVLTITANPASYTVPGIASFAASSFTVDSNGAVNLTTVLTNTTASFTTAQETKLSGIATGATANSPDATLLARANHTGTQDINTTTTGTLTGSRVTAATDTTAGAVPGIGGTAAGNAATVGQVSAESSAAVSAHNTDPAAHSALIADATTAALTLSKIGDNLINVLRVRWPANPGTAHFATIGAAATNFTVRTTTGFAKLINSDGTLSSDQFGSGDANSIFNVTIPASGLHRALGVVSVANNGNVRSGNILTLNLPTNQLTSFSGTGLSSLTSLNLSSNQLTSFSGTGMSALANLNLSINQLTSFSGTGLSALATLNLSNNQLTSFSGTSLSALVNLFLSGNRLTSFSGTGLSALTTLNLSSNQLTSFSGTGLSALVNLFLSGNQLTSFSGTGLSALTRLDLSNNQLTSVDMDGAVLSYGSYFYYFYYGSSLANNLLSGAALDAFYTSLGVDTSAQGLIIVTNNPGTTSDNPTIATAKGYTIVGT